MFLSMSSLNVMHGTKGSSLPPTSPSCSSLNTQLSLSVQTWATASSLLQSARRQHWMPSELAPWSRAFAGKHCGWAHSAHPSSFRGYHGFCHMELDVSQTQMLYLGGETRAVGPGRGSPGNGLRDGLLHKGWVPSLLLLEPCGVH